MALALTNCLLSQSRKPSHPCPLSRDIGECLSSIGGDAWTSYASFYVHVDTLCHYFGSLDWEERTSTLIDNLTTVSSLSHAAI